MLKQEGKKRSAWVIYIRVKINFDFYPGINNGGPYDRTIPQILIHHL